MITAVEIATYRVGMFELDSVTQRPIPGYTADERWNGWACPYFDKSAADDLVAQLNESYAQLGQPRRAFYDAGRDVYVTPYDGGDQDDWESWGVQIITIEGEKRAVYPIGDFSWCWIERDPSK